MGCHPLAGWHWLPASGLQTPARCRCHPARCWCHSQDAVPPGRVALASSQWPADRCHRARCRERDPGCGCQLLAGWHWLPASGRSHRQDAGATQQDAGVTLPGAWVPTWRVALASSQWRDTGKMPVPPTGCWCHSGKMPVPAVRVALASSQWPADTGKMPVPLQQAAGVTPQDAGCHWQGGTGFQPVAGRPRQDAGDTPQAAGAISLAWASRSRPDTFHFRSDRNCQEQSLWPVSTSGRLRCSTTSGKRAVEPGPAGGGRADNRARPGPRREGPRRRPTPSRPWHGRSRSGRPAAEHGLEHRLHQRQVLLAEVVARVHHQLQGGGVDLAEEPLGTVDGADDVPLVCLDRQHGAVLFGNPGVLLEARSCTGDSLARSGSPDARPFRLRVERAGLGGDQRGSPGASSSRASTRAGFAELSPVHVGIDDVVVAERPDDLDPCPLQAVTTLRAAAQSGSSGLKRTSANAKSEPRRLKPSALICRAASSTGSSA